MDKQPVNEQTPEPVSKLPLWWVVTVNALVLLITSQFFFLPRGTRTRAEGWGLWVFMLAGAGIIGIILGMRRRYERMPYQWLVIVLGFTPLPLAMGIAQVARLVRGFVFTP